MEFLLKLFLVVFGGFIVIFFVALVNWEFIAFQKIIRGFLFG